MQILPSPKLQSSAARSLNFIMKVEAEVFPKTTLLDVPHMCSLQKSSRACAALRTLGRSWFRLMRSWWNAASSAGRRHAAFVELDFCPEIEEGGWVEVLGAVQGGFAGRGDDQETIVRLRVQGTAVSPRARVLGESGG